MSGMRGQGSRASTLGASDPRNRRAGQNLAAVVAALPVQIDSEGRVGVKKMAAVKQLEGFVTVSDIGNKINEILIAFKDAGYMER